MKILVFIFSFISLTTVQSCFGQIALDWQKCYGGSGQEYATSICNTNDGGYAFVGNTNSTNGDLAGLNAGAWLVKINSTGNIQWQKTYASMSGPQTVIQLKTGGFVIGDLFALHYLDSLGNLVWTDSNMRKVYAVTEKPDGTLLVAGKNPLFSSVDVNIAVWRLKPETHTQYWVKNYSFFDNTNIKKIILNSEGFACGGEIVISSVGPEPFFMRMNDTGKLLFSSYVLAGQQSMLDFT